MAGLFDWKRIGSWIARRRADSAAEWRLRTLLDSLDGKSVAIVGNSMSLLSHRYGDLIDGHDIVVRMTKGFPTDPAASGQPLRRLVLLQHPHGALGAGRYSTTARRLDVAQIPRGG